MIPISFICMTLSTTNYFVDSYAHFDETVEENILENKLLLVLM